MFIYILSAFFCLFAFPLHDYLTANLRDTLYKWNCEIPTSFHYIWKLSKRTGRWWSNFSQGFLLISPAAKTSISNSLGTTNLACYVHPFRACALVIQRTKTDYYSGGLVSTWTCSHSWEKTAILSYIHLGCHFIALTYSLPLWCGYRMLCQEVLRGKRMASRKSN